MQVSDRSNMSINLQRFHRFWNHHYLTLGCKAPAGSMEEKDVSELMRIRAQIDRAIAQYSSFEFGLLIKVVCKWSFEANIASTWAAVCFASVSLQILITTQIIAIGHDSSIFESVQNWSFSQDNFKNWLWAYFENWLLWQVLTSIDEHWHKYCRARSQFCNTQSQLNFNILTFIWNFKFVISQ